MTRDFRIALVGAGAIGNAYAQAAAGLPGASVVAVADVNADAADSLAAASGAQAVHDPLSLAHNDRVELALICTPPATHEELCVGFLEAGVPVMCEKPLSVDTLSARRILTAAVRTGTPITMASKFRFVPDVIQARSIIQAGTLGDVVRTEVAFTSRVDMSRRWNADPAVGGGGVLIDNGTHAVDVLRYAFGPAEKVLAAIWTTNPALRVEDTAAVLVRTLDGKIGSIDLSWNLDRLTDRYLAVFGSEGSLEVGWRASRLRTTSSPVDRPFGTGYDKIQALRENLRNVVDALQGRAEFVVTGADAIASVAAVEAAYESARTEEWVTVPSRRAERQLSA
ncbi:MAG: hypothetical protein QOI54_3153 [Actinomycetota bacterium]|jgi:predicted dehydrogenase|nr:hypothetical protein [Actinomycetota bacterium]